jgi:hypothetical protein
MTRILFLITTILTFTASPGHAQGIRGNIRNKADEPVPYTAIYVSALHKGTTANEEGFFQLGLPPGVHEVRFQYLGYVTQVLSVTIADTFTERNIILEEQQYRLPEVIVTASGEDPAYYIMRRAIGMSQYYLNQVSAYSSLVYLKGSGVINNMPALMKRQMERDGIEEGKYFVTETISRIHFELPDQVRTEVISLRSSGDDNQSSPMAFVTISLYRDINGIISPLSRNAFQVYRFELEGSFMENGDQINKIRVIPRRPGPDLYSGTIFIREGGWNIHSVDLQVTQNMFSIGIRQVYNPVAESVWMPVSHNFDVNLSLLGFDVDFTYLASVSDYQVTLNADLDHDFYLSAGNTVAELTRLRRLDAGLQSRQAEADSLAERTISMQGNSRQEAIQQLMAKDNLNNREMRRMNRLIKREARLGRPKESLEVMPANTEISDSARLHSKEYWDTNRPVPLTSNELESFEETIPDTTGQDGESAERKRIAGKILTGSRYKLAERWHLQHGGLPGFSGLGFNTVDGFTFGQNIRLSHDAQNRRRFHVANRTTYAFARKRLLSEAEVGYNYHPFRRATIKLSGGRTTSDFNSDNGIPPMFNAVTSLYVRQNLLKLYEKDFIRLDHQIDITNGLVLKTGIEYASRRRLENHSDFYFLNPYGYQYNPNLPPKNGLPVSSLDNHRAALIDAGLNFTPRYFYRLADARKIMLYSRYPTFGVNYQLGIAGLWDSDTRFSHLEVSVNQSFTMQMIGQFTYRATAGTFFHDDGMYFADYKHFFTNPLWVKPGNSPDMFRVLPYYSSSTNDDYAGFHLQYDHNRIILKRLPFLADKLMREKLFVNSLLTKENKPWVELGYGLDQIFLILNIEVVTAFSGGRHEYTGFRIGIPLSEATIRL